MNMKIVSIFFISLSIATFLGCTQPASSSLEEEDVKVVKDTTGRSVLLNKEEIRIKVGDSFQLSATILPEGDTSGVVFESGDTDIASVNSSGFITGVKEGTTKVSATSGFASKSCTVYVVEEVVDIAGPPPATPPADTTTTPVVTTVSEDFILDFVTDGQIYDGYEYSYTIAGREITKSDLGTRLVGSSSLNLNSHQAKFITLNFYKGSVVSFLKLKTGATGNKGTDYELVSCTTANETNYLVYQAGKWSIWDVPALATNASARSISSKTPFEVK